MIISRGMTTSMFGFWLEFVSQSIYSSESRSNMQSAELNQ